MLGLAVHIVLDPEIAQLREPGDEQIAGPAPISVDAGPDSRQARFRWISWRQKNVAGKAGQPRQQRQPADGEDAAEDPSRPFAVRS